VRERGSPKDEGLGSMAGAVLARSMTRMPSDVGLLAFRRSLGVVAGDGDSGDVGEVATGWDERPVGLREFMRLMSDMGLLSFRRCLGVVADEGDSGDVGEVAGDCDEVTVARRRGRAEPVGLRVARRRGRSIALGCGCSC
jgi:hypothetical protein